MTRGQALRRTLSLLLLGMVAGASITMLAEGKVLDRLYLKHESLTIKYNDLVQELNHVEQELFLVTAQKNSANPTLKSIKITIDNGDPRTQLEASKFIKASLNFLIGTQVRIFADAPSVITEVIDRKTFIVNGQRYALDLRTAVMLGDTLYITVQTKPAKG